MPDPVDYRDPRLQDERAERLRRARGTVRVGAFTFLLCFATLFTPMLIGGQLGKFVVAPAIVGMCWGLSCLLHGGWDWWRGRSA